MNLKELVKFYHNNVKKHKNEIGSPAWGSKKSQEKRFDILTQIGDIKGKSILDVGCGLGDMYGWLKTKHAGFKYEGMDITPSMIKMAKSNYPGVKFRVADILKIDKPKYDYILASGIFNRKVKNHEKFLKSSVLNMFKLCKIGIAFNIMSVKADFKEKNEYYAEPDVIFRFCLNISRKVVLRHDYMPHDFTIYIYRENY